MQRYDHAVAAGLFAGYAEGFANCHITSAATAAFGPSREQNCWPGPVA